MLMRGKYNTKFSLINYKKLKKYIKKLNKKQTDYGKSKAHR